MSKPPVPLLGLLCQILALSSRSGALPLTIDSDNAVQLDFPKVEDELQRRFSLLTRHLDAFSQQAQAGQYSAATSLLEDAQAQLRKKIGDWEETCRLKSVGSPDWDECQTTMERIKADIKEEDAKIQQLADMLTDGAGA
eukprot:TRINITY_DN49302_c0_g1_i1.p1 TRINITY_DN49302_c0_g1~~TRINITY_DN49302_c0_g1_i1.p1  ORF type:complete len:146 (-),score=32.94 TRINITY_DN49302_c0_g1_i1:149-565(-)